jgi:riboflavin biosynthesis pyrimidine reductase
LLAILSGEYAVKTLLCEGGARVFGQWFREGLIDEEFVTWCPIFVGGSTEHFRPSYCEDVTWTPTTAPYSKPISLHRAGDYLFLHTRCSYSTD